MVFRGTQKRSDGREEMEDYEKGEVKPTGETPPRRMMLDDEIASKGGLNKGSALTLIMGLSLIASFCLVFYINGEYHVNKALVDELRAELATVEGELKLISAKFQTSEQSLEKAHLEKLQVINEMDKAKSELDNKLDKERSELNNKLTLALHDLEEMKVKANRIMRDNNELHKRLQTKSAELDMLESRTTTFQKDMSKIRSALKKAQGEEEEDLEAMEIDYEQLYKKQEKQQESIKDRIGFGHHRHHSLVSSSVDEE